jgi:DNA-binding MarR family transcriptional regulator
VPTEPRAGAQRASPADVSLITCVELLFFAYRDFTREADAVLAEFGLGRAHHRVLHFVNRNPGLKVAELLEILKITKQSLARVLKQLVDQGWIVQIAGSEDRRQRLLHTTEKGAGLANRLDALQARRVAQALGMTGPDSETVVRDFLFAMIAGEERAFVNAVLPQPVEPIV